MNDTETTEALDILANSTNIDDLQDALMKFALKIDGNNCPRPLREKLWKAISGNIKFWRLFTDSQNITLPQMAGHVLASFGDDDFLPNWPFSGEIISKLASRLKDVPSEKEHDVASFSKDLLLACLSCSRISMLNCSIASVISAIVKQMSMVNLVKNPELLIISSDIMRNMVITEKWYKDGIVRTSFTCLVKAMLQLASCDQTAEKFLLARSVGALLLNASPPSSAKHRNVVVEAMLPEPLRIPLADSMRSVILSRTVSASSIHLKAVIVLNAGLQRWLCREGQLWIFNEKSKLFNSENGLDLFLFIFISLNFPFKQSFQI